MHVTTPAYRDSQFKRLAASAAYPIFSALNRPSMAWFSNAVYDFALRCNGFAVNFPGRHGINRNEERLLERIAGQVGAGVVFDVGASHGSYTRALARLMPQARIYAFEPHPKTFASLRARAAELPGFGDRIHLRNQALTDRPGALELHDFADEDGSTQASLSRGAVELFSPRTVSHAVECSTIDAVMAAEGVREIAFLKIDTEGFDLNVLKGAAAALAERRIGVIQFEFIPANLVTGVTVRDFFELLEGYRIHRLCVSGALLPLSYSVKRCEVFTVHNLVATRSP